MKEKEEWIGTAIAYFGKNYDMPVKTGIKGVKGKYWHVNDLPLPKQKIWIDKMCLCEENADEV